MKELKETLELNPHITKVHFTESGEHFFNVHDNNQGGYTANGQPIVKTLSRSEILTSKDEVVEEKTEPKKGKK
jgi:hypothetical protein